MARNNEDNERYRIFTRRALLLGGGQVALLSALVGRMYYLQVLEADRYATLAEENRINLKLLAPRRGRIFDRFGVPLAANQQNFRVMLLRENTDDLEATLAALGQIVEVKEHELKRVHREIGRKRAFVPITVRENLSWEELARVELHSPNLPGISIEVGETRRYPYGASMAHVLGYVAAVSEQELTGDRLLELPGFRIGKNGIERQYDHLLRGKAGTSQVEVNAYGRIIRELSRSEGEPGREPVLTLDVGLQNFVHQRLMSERSAAAVVLDIETGDVLALTSVPSFDPSAFNIGLTSEQWSALIGDPLHPLTNKSVSGTFAPGSTFKMTVALAALEMGIGADQRAFCPGFKKLGRSRFHCWKKYGHGWLDMRGGIQQSCDVYFYELAFKVGIDRISDMAKRLGLGVEVGIDLPHERAGTVPTRAWKLATIGEPWQGGETLVTGIGQGFLLTTPLQLAVMTARLASGRQVTPRLTRGFLGDGESKAAPAEPVFEPLGVKDANLTVIHEAMDAVSNHPRGTAYRYRIEEEEQQLAGKTGTAQVRRISLAERSTGVLKNEDMPWRFRDHGLFVCFAPVQQPRYACAVVVEHGGGSGAAAPVARDIVLEAQRLRSAERPVVPLIAVAPAPRRV
jgi:penicillin-binding protein 2